ncbi:MAG: hypothetical protein LZF62_480290 [Nitrospira sp.]|nr:MAG: hypothetical protein LZF62_480290 [Nitrospira sp.]
MRVQSIALYFRLAMQGCHLFRRRPCPDSRGLSPEICGSLFRSGAVRLVLLLSMVGLSGCHITWPFDRPASFLDSAQFMDTWKTYLHCRSSVEPEEIRADLQQLNRVAQAVSMPNHPSVLLLPAAVRTLIATLPSRLAVDPHAMSAACALHGGDVAQAAGLPGLSVALLTAVVAAQQSAANAYYAVEVHQRLKGMEYEIPVRERVSELVGRGVSR